MIHQIAPTEETQLAKKKRAEKKTIHVVKGARV